MPYGTVNLSGGSGSEFVLPQPAKGLALSRFNFTLSGTSKVLQAQLAESADELA